QNGRTLPIIRLEKAISAQPGTVGRRSNVIVFEMFEREIGLLAETIHDIRQLASDVDVVTCIEPGVIGSYIEADRTVRLLDVYRVARTQYPEWFQNDVRQSGPEETILIAEDSAFFRTQITRSMEESNYKVITAENGKRAWDLLNAHGSEISMVVTDVEMPQMTGLELCDQIRKSEEFRNMPVIVLSSLGSDNDVARGINVGVDEYHVKFNQDQLLRGVKRLLAKKRAQSKTNAAQATGGLR
ncbi:MAG: response regulator, partial [Planctomycetales bacterium]|nr:response regulator [Planctomycetales bacterium]